jgi:hypothetical protein
LVPGLLETIGKFPEDQPDFRPLATSWSARQTILHVAQEEHGEFGYEFLPRWACWVAKGSTRESGRQRLVLWPDEN